MGLCLPLRPPPPPLPLLQPTTAATTTAAATANKPQQTHLPLPRQWQLCPHRPRCGNHRRHHRRSRQRPVPAVASPTRAAHPPSSHRRAGRTPLPLRGSQAVPFVRQEKVHAHRHHHGRSVSGGHHGGSSAAAAWTPSHHPLPQPHPSPSPPPLRRGSRIGGGDRRARRQAAASL